ncbi:hypothetical protein NL676_031223 [Syzygium grande]|nr:hypothetical protein NL676_031223 [Syzygium grande]
MLLPLNYFFAVRDGVSDDVPNASRGKFCMVRPSNVGSSFLDCGQYEQVDNVEYSKGSHSLPVRAWTTHSHAPPSLLHHYHPLLRFDCRPCRLLLFHHRPPPSVPAAERDQTPFDFARRNAPNLRLALTGIAATADLQALIIDGFSDAAFPVAAALGIPTCYFSTSGAVALTLFLHFPTLHGRTTKSFKDLGDETVNIPGLPPIRALDMPSGMLDRGWAIYGYFLDACRNMISSSGIIVNTCESLETRIISTIKEGSCVPDGLTPPIFAVRPMVESKVDGDENGLERSGVRFLWVVQPPPQDESAKSTSRSNEDDETSLEKFLPTGFLERTRERGMVVKSRAPQIQPLYAEQKVNRAFLVEEAALALPLSMSDEDGFVSADELAKRVTELMMGSGQGKVVRERVLAARDGVLEALSDGGSSQVSLAAVAALWKRG